MYRVLISTSTEAYQIRVPKSSVIRSTGMYCSLKEIEKNYICHWMREAQTIQQVGFSSLELLFLRSYWSGWLRSRRDSHMNNDMLHIDFYNDHLQDW